MEKESFEKFISVVDELQVTIENENHAACEEFWNTLSKKQQMMAFYSVVSRIVDGEFNKKKSFRGILYDVFNFGPESYAIGMDSGYMTLHNALVESTGD